MTETLVIFVRAPVAGQTKTRLIPGLGNEGAARAYRRMAEHVVAVARRVQRPDLDRVLLVEPPTAVSQVGEWLGDDFRVGPQAPGDLGEKLADAFDLFFSEGAERVVAMGTDCTLVTPGLIEGAFARLADHDVVIGPTLDGGYYLIGTSRHLPQAFERVPWSTRRTARVTLERLLTTGADVALLPTLRDIDTPRDLDALAAHWKDLER